MPSLGPNAKPNAQVSAQVNAEALVQNQAPAPAPGSSSWIPAMPTQTRLYRKIIAHGSVSGQCQGVGNQKGAVGNDLPAIRPVFKTPLPDGPFRDEIVFEIVSMDCRDFNGTITSTEARRKIFEEVLGLDQEIITSITLGFNRGRIITYKLKKQLDVDQLFRN